jgi:hypothetical protein
VRTLITQPVTWLLAVVLVVGLAVFYRANQPASNRIPRYSGAVPTVPCAAGQSPEKSPFCLVTPNPNVSKMPDTNVSPEPSNAVPVSAPPGIVYGSAQP